MSLGTSGDTVTRGFVTVATGNVNYYKLARNLLRSYRMFNIKYPFAILCDRKNKYTDEFDDVIILENANKNYVDKLRVLKEAPYDENFFIETDCLVYKNIDVFFDLLAKDGDFSAFGYDKGDLSVWFSSPELVKDRYGVDYISLFNPGYFFVRKSNVSNKIFDDAMEIGEWITSNNIQGGSLTLIHKGMLRDDPLLALSMTINNCTCPENHEVGKCIFLPRVKKILDISFLNGKLHVVQEKEFNNCNILHFSSRRTKEEGLYLQQSLVVNMLYKHYPIWLIKIFEKRFVGVLFHLYRKIKYRIIYTIKNK